MNAEHDALYGAARGGAAATGAPGKGFGARGIDRDSPVFVISVAAQLAQMHPQTLRQYDRLGLVIPSRQRGKHRRYSANDVARLRRIQQLSTEGISLEGIRRMIELESELGRMRLQLTSLQDELSLWRGRARERTAPRVFSAGSSGVVSVRGPGGRQAAQPGPLGLPMSLPPGPSSSAR